MVDVIGIVGLVAAFGVPITIEFMKKPRIRIKAARRAARAAATARTPSLPLALPLRRRQRRSAGAKNEMRAA